LLGVLGFRDPSDEEPAEWVLEMDWLEAEGLLLLLVCYLQ